MKRFIAAVTILITLVLTTRAHAMNVLLETEGNSETKSLFIDASGELNSFEWHGSIGRSATRTLNPDTSVSQDYITQDFSLGGGHRLTESLDLGLDVLTSRTAEAKYSEVGGGISLRYNYEHESSNEEFSPQGSVSLRLGRTNIKQSISFVILNKLIEREPTIEQGSLDLGWSFQPLEKFSFSVGITGFSYNYSKADLQTTFGSRFLNFYTSDFVTTVGGLPESRGRLSLSYFLTEKLDIELATSKTKLIVDGSESNSTKLAANYQFEKFGVQAGFRVSKSESFKENSGILGLNFNL